MAGPLVAGAALGALFGETLKGILAGVLEVKRNAVNFNSTFSRLEKTLTSIGLIVNDIEALNRLLERREEETHDLVEQMMKGKELISKCSKIYRYNYWDKYWYMKKLQRLEESIRRFIGVNMFVQSTRDVKEVLAEVKDLRTELRRRNSVERDSFRQNGLPDPCAAPEPPSLTVGIDACLGELKMKLLSPGTAVHVVSAPGGCGKTTLASKICHEEEIKGKFKDNIFFVIVSKVPNTKVIIQKIFQHKVCQTPEFQNEEDAVTQLEQLLKQIEPNPILMVLDDVWSGSESLVDKFRFQLSDYKIMVTSRSAFPRFDSTYHLKPLNDEDARTLFVHSACLQTESSFIQDEDLINKIVRGCKGVPLALKVVGRSLCGQPAAIWRSRMMEWSKGHSIFNSERDLLVCLQSSLDVLDNQLKECFMDLGSFPEDQRVNAAALIDIWVELYGLDEDGVYALVNLYELSNRNLANLVVTREDASDVDCFDNELVVMQHDLLRELAIYQSSLETIEQRKRLIVNITEDKHPEWCMDTNQQPFNCRLLSISTDEMFSSSWCNMRLPKVEVLVLNLQTKNYTLPVFMEEMNKLKVLIVTNYGFFPTELSNFPLLGSLPNLKRIRLEKVKIPSLNQITLPLPNLQKLSLVMCDIDQAFKNCSIQIANMLPNLVEINIDYSVDMVALAAALYDIVHLKKLSITNCHKLSSLEGIEKLVNIEVLWLHSCTALLEIPDSIGSLHNLKILDISNCLTIKQMPNRIGELCNLQKLNMRGCSGLSKLPPTTRNLKHLEVVICDEETATLWEMFMPSLTQLRIEVLNKDINLNWLEDPDH